MGVDPSKAACKNHNVCKKNCDTGVDLHVALLKDLAW